MADDWARSTPADLHGGCQTCGRTDVSLKKDGTLRHHAGQSGRGSSFLSEREYRCKGSGKPPKPVEEK